MERFNGLTVIVLDNSNYKSSYAEKCPFKAIVTYVYENEIEVTSVETGKEYELYPNQILEAMDIYEIKFMLNGGKYGGYENSKLIKEGKFFK